MDDQWIAHALLVVPAAHRAAAAQIFAQVSGNAADAAPEAFGVALAALEGGEVTHWATHTRVRASTLEALPQLAHLVPGALWCVTAHDDDTPEQADARASVADFLETHRLAIASPIEEGETDDDRAE